jgi:hypothetical protein
MGVEWESILTFGFMAQRTGVGERKNAGESGGDKQIWRPSSRQFSTDLRYVIAVAEELHVGRAAKRLHLSRPGVTLLESWNWRSISATYFSRSSRDKLPCHDASGIGFITEARRRHYTRNELPNA